MFLLSWQINDEPKSPIEEAKERLIKNPQINFQPQSNSEEVEKQPNRNLLNEIRTKQQRLSIQQIKETKHVRKSCFLEFVFLQNIYKLFAYSFRMAHITNMEKKHLLTQNTRSIILNQNQCQAPMKMYLNLI